MNQGFGNTGFTGNGMLNLIPRQALEQCRAGACLVDVREEYMNRYKTFDVPEIICCPYSLLKEVWQELPAGKRLIFADAAGLHSKEAVQFLIDKGWGDRIANLAGGLVEWERDGLPLVVDQHEKLTGSCMCQLKPRNR